MTYLNAAQVEQLLKPINPKRVGKDGKNFSHMQAYDIRAHLIRVFGFARWSVSVISTDVVFEDRTDGEKPTDKPKWTVCYRATVGLSVFADDGTYLASYEDGATGEAKNQPFRGDAHDLALKTALSQALKRAAVNLGDQFGLSLYNKGSLNGLVGGVICAPKAEDGDKEKADGSAASVDDHITEPLAAENETAEPAPEVRDRNDSPAEPSDALSAADAIRDTLQAVLAAPADSNERAKTIGSLMKQAQRDKCMAVKVDTDNGPVALKILLENALRGSRAA